MIANQDYQNIEHIVIEGYSSTIGEKRNQACAMATGEVIVHYDDDDFYSHDYISKALGHLCFTGAYVTGLSSAYFLHENNREAWLYKYNGSAPYVIGSGMMYYKRVWEGNRFKYVNNGEDTMFLANAGFVSPHGNIDTFVAMIHGGNTASQNSIKTMLPTSVDLPLNILNKCNNFTEVSLGRAKS